MGWSRAAGEQVIGDGVLFPVGGSAQGKVLVRASLSGPSPTGEACLFDQDSRESWDTVGVFLGKTKSSQQAASNLWLLNGLISKKCLREETKGVISFAEGGKSLLPVQVPHLPS